MRCAALVGAGSAGGLAVHGQTRHERNVHGAAAVALTALTCCLGSAAALSVASGRRPVRALAVAANAARRGSHRPSTAGTVPLHDLLASRTTRSSVPCPPCQIHQSDHASYSDAKLSDFAVPVRRQPLIMFPSNGNGLTVRLSAKVSESTLRARHRKSHFAEQRDASGIRLTTTTHIPELSGSRRSGFGPPSSW
jgi:hypothetical protein